MMEYKPTVSIIMAAYNSAHCLKHTIASILQQKFHDFEFIIIDDGSQDQTVALIHGYADKRIVLHSNTVNRGQTASLNIGLHLARGKYIARIDADDISLPDRLSKQFYYLEQYSDVDVIGTAAFQYDEHQNIKGIARMPATSSDIRSSILFTSPLVHVSVMARRQAILEVGGYDEQYRILADFALWSKMLQRGYRLLNLPDILVGYRVSAHSFGSRHLRGESVSEAGRIIQQNVRWLTGISFTLEQAENIWKYYTFNLSDIGENDLANIEADFEMILRAAGCSKRRTHFIFLRKYFRHLFSQPPQHGRRPHVRYILRSLLNRIDGMAIGKVSLQYLYQSYLDLLWKQQNNHSSYVANKS